MGRTSSLAARYSVWMLAFSAEYRAGAMRVSHSPWVRVRIKVKVEVEI